MAERTTAATAPLLARYFDELAVGDRQTTRGRTVTEADLVNWCSLTGDWFRLHSDRPYAEASMFGQRIAPGIMIFAYITGLGVPADSPTILANYGTDRLRYPAPVFIGDTIRLDAEVAELADRDDRTGIALLRWDGLNQSGATVCASQLKVLLAKSSTPSGGAS